MNDEQAKSEPTLVEKWIQDQQEWHKMAMEYYDSMVNNDEFLTHLGNAMRGSLLAGKPYPGTERPDAADEPAPADDRIDQILHALHLLQGEVADLKMSLEEIRSGQTNTAADSGPALSDDAAPSASVPSAATTEVAASKESPDAPAGTDTRG